ncbi:MAG: 2-C-methyl-D-erythritol 2,4-cyclodiphosphate synthase [Planctomycetota bacterium]|nr:2-C-methyl-D-erythritol 2,4-cyclodiphosphate synthase [Planctomycetota bacterium]
MSNSSEESAVVRQTRVGIGTDRHRLEVGRPLMLAAVAIPSPHGPVAHSDGDVILHALSDAMLGAAGCEDIGAMFEDTDPRWKNLASRQIVDEVLKKIGKLGWKPLNIDLVVHLEKPKLAEHRDSIRQSLSEMLSIEPAAIGMKAKTGEGVGPVGESLVIEALAVVQLMSTEE